jgi:hypothetical protein
MTKETDEMPTIFDIILTLVVLYSLAVSYGLQRGLNETRLHVNALKRQLAERREGSPPYEEAMAFYRGEAR